MSKRLIVSLLFILFTFTACSQNDSLKGDKPPKTQIKVGNQTYETKLGTYCWESKGQAECVDTAGPIELLKDEKKIPVKAGEVVKIVMNYSPKPGEIHLNEIVNNKESEVIIENNHFTVPTKKGIYYYSYGVYWRDKKDKHVSHGDAFYAFALEVK
ncbi:hypothetical protein CN692_13490 [Bacillus sp. AFS002410]|uniref:hypothetical protein n=1 Tax=Bacillus sp. AFS002410 TaxID=2033481 RepID=UPI000BF22E6C|nr:hypothetical protein [Bacillus sp. AFS002410]PEJ57161.1 hypothetical protein CN692_13490 [Bacillus sp. AFS002410]